MTGTQVYLRAPQSKSGCSFYGSGVIVCKNATPVEGV